MLAKGSVMALRKINTITRCTLALAAGAAVLGIAAPAYAQVISIGGGTWDFGENGSTVWSHYYHGSACHGSSVYTNVVKRSPDTAAGSWARISAAARPWQVDSSYWRHC